MKRLSKQKHSIVQITAQFVKAQYYVLSVAKVSWLIKKDFVLRVSHNQLKWFAQLKIVFLARISFHVIFVRKAIKLNKDYVF
jgi:hypothetical protein